jgi:hypothetical protein
VDCPLEHLVLLELLVHLLAIWLEILYYPENLLVL